MSVPRSHTNFGGVETPAAAQEITKLAALRDRGVLSAEEFAVQRAALVDAAERRVLLPEYLTGDELTRLANVVDAGELSEAVLEAAKTRLLWHEQRTAPEPRPAANVRAFSVVLALAGAGLFVGAAMPWVTATTIFGSIDMAGTSGDGKITLALGLVIFAIGGWFFLGRPSRPWAVAGLIVSVATLGMVAYEIVHVWHAVSDIQNRYVVGTVGSGLWLSLVGAIAALVTAAGITWSLQPASAGPPTSPRWPTPQDRQPGWKPDPWRSPGGERFWDGGAWSPWWR